jgi:hypothetical protein
MGALTDMELRTCAYYDERTNGGAPEKALVACVRRLAGRCEELETDRDSLLDRVCEDCTTQGCPHHTAPPSGHMPGLTCASCYYDDATETVMCATDLPTGKETPPSAGNVPSGKAHAVTCGCSDCHKRAEEFARKMRATPTENPPSTHPGDVSKKAGEIDTESTGAKCGCVGDYTCDHCIASINAEGTTPTSEEKGE